MNKQTAIELLQKNGYEITSDTKRTTNTIGGRTVLKKGNWQCTCGNKSIYFWCGVNNKHIDIEDFVEGDIF